MKVAFLDMRMLIFKLHGQMKDMCYELEGIQRSETVLFNYFCLKEHPKDRNPPLVQCPTASNEKNTHKQMHAETVFMRFLFSELRQTGSCARHLTLFTFVCWLQSSI